MRSNAELTYITPLLPGKVEEWDELRDAAAATVQGMGPDDIPDLGQVRAIMGRVSVLDNPRLERARYMGLGFMAGALEAYLEEEENTVDTIELAAELVKERHQERYGQQDRTGLRLSDFTGDAMRLAFESAVLDASSNLPIELRLLADSLHLASLRRKSDMSRQGKLPTFQHVRTLELGARLAGNVAPAASTNLVRRALVGSYAFRHQISTAAVVRRDPFISQIKGEKGIRRIDVLKLGANMARLRFDEINDPDIVEPRITRTPAGEYDFDSSYFRTLPAPPKALDLCGEEDIRLLHTERIGCPALYVPHLLERVLAMIPEIAISADVKIRHT